METDVELTLAIAAVHEAADLERDAGRLVEAIGAIRSVRAGTNGLDALGPAITKVAKVHAQLQRRSADFNRAIRKWEEQEHE